MRAAPILALPLSLALSLVPGAQPRAAVADVPCLPGLDLSVTPAAPLLGEPITIQVTNNTAGTFWFPVGCAVDGAFAGGCGGTPIWTPLCIQVYTSLVPGATFAITWDQTDSTFGQQVPPGRYGFPISMVDDSFQPVGCCIEVTIHGPCLTPPAPYGFASAGTGGIAPVLAAANGPAFFGNAAFHLAVSQGRGAAAGALCIGAAPGNVSAPWGTFLLNPALPLILVPFTLSGASGVAGAGSALFPAPIPDDPALIGLTAYAQALIADPEAQAGVSQTAGLTIPICP